jgi:DNA ligase D
VKRHGKEQEKRKREKESAIPGTKRRSKKDRGQRKEAEAGYLADGARKVPGLTENEPSVRVSSPDKIYFPELGVTKGQVFHYYQSVAAALIAHSFRRPIILKRYPHGIDGKFFYQKRAPDARPDWVTTATYRFPSGRSADEVVLDRAATLLWTVQLGNIEIHAHPVRADDLDHPDELRIDLDPGPGVDFKDVRAVAMVAREILGEHKLSGFPKTSGGRGLHIYAPIAQRWSFDEVRRAGLALAREAARRVPKLATARWWKEERHGVFIDYNQNARDRTMAAAYSLRANPRALVSTPLHWDEVPDCDPGQFSIFTVPARIERVGTLFTETRRPGSLQSLLELAATQEAAGESDAPWPPMFPGRGKQPGRPKRTRAPLLIVARAATEKAARAGLEAWKKRHPKAAAHVRVEDILVDTMRGRSSTWIRIRVNLRNVPVTARPAPEPPDPDEPGS